MDWFAIAMLFFLFTWLWVPPYWLYKRWRAFTLPELILAIIAVIGAEFMLAIVLAFMNAISYGGIFNVRFWTS